MNYRQARRAFKQKGTVAQLFVLRESELQNTSEPHTTSKSQSTSELATNPPRLLIAEFHDVFTIELPDKPPPERPFVHTIDTKDAKPINRNPCPLSVIQRTELLNLEDIILPTLFGILKYNKYPGIKTFDDLPCL